eukprot:GHVT01037315.1.p1 GENE.GHVT01037315.1~~GHVT01037315.1.p1  ORF type:complete len:664 (+),score=181.86 GHVT01037315.1:358-2349(+)
MAAADSSQPAASPLDMEAPISSVAVNLVGLQRVRPSCVAACLAPFGEVANVGQLFRSLRTVQRDLRSLGVFHTIEAEVHSGETPGSAACTLHLEEKKRTATVGAHVNQAGATSLDLQASVPSALGGLETFDFTASFLGLRSQDLSASLLFPRLPLALGHDWHGLLKLQKSQLDCTSHSSLLEGATGLSFRLSRSGSNSSFQWEASLREAVAVADGSRRASAAILSAPVQSLKHSLKWTYRSCKSPGDLRHEPPAEGLAKPRQDAPGNRGSAAAAAAGTSAESPHAPPSQEAAKQVEDAGSSFFSFPSCLSWSSASCRFPWLPRFGRVGRTWESTLEASLPGGDTSHVRAQVYAAAVVPVSLFALPLALHAALGAGSLLLPPAEPKPTPGSAPSSLSSSELLSASSPSAAPLPSSDSFPSSSSAPAAIGSDGDEPGGRSLVHPADRFHLTGCAGGGTALRGFGYKAVGPSAPGTLRARDYLGENSYWTMNLSVSCPLHCFTSAAAAAGQHVSAAVTRGCSATLQPEPCTECPEGIDSSGKMREELDGGGGAALGAPSPRAAAVAETEGSSSGSRLFAFATFGGLSAASVSDVVFPADVQNASLPAAVATLLGTPRVAIGGGFSMPFPAGQGGAVEVVVAKGMQMGVHDQCGGFQIGVRINAVGG